MKKIVRYEVECHDCGNVAIVSRALKLGELVFDERGLVDELSALGWSVFVQIKTWPKPPRVQVFCQDHRLSVVPDTTDQDAIDAAFHVVEFKKRKAAE